MGTIDLPSFALGAAAALVLVVIIRVLRRDVDPTRTSGNAITYATRGFPAIRPASPTSGFPSIRPAAPQRPPVVGPPSQRITELLRQGRKIEAIKLYREQTGAGLVVAKEAVEAIERRYAASGADRSNRR